MVSRRSIEAQEDIVIDFQFALTDILNHQNLTKELIARRCNLSKKTIEDLFDSGSNPTIKQLAEIFDALDHKITVKIDPIK